MSMIFESIKSFVNDLGEFFAKDSHPLALYERLINKTTLQHTEAVQKHVDAFTKFCTENKTNILSKTVAFNSPISYSPRVYIDLNNIFTYSNDPDTIECIWSHILTISALVDPQSGALAVLKSKNSTPKLELENEDEEGDFLNDLINKVESHVSAGDGVDPQAAVASIMSSGLLTDLIGSMTNGVNSGKLDMTKMMSSVQKMVGKFSSEMSPDGVVPESDSGISNVDPMQMLSSLMGMMGGNGGANGLDPMSILSNMMMSPGNGPK